MTSLRDNVIQKIRQERIEPVSSWRFRFFRGLGWVGLLVSVILASLFTAFAFHVISEIDWEAYSHVNISWYQGALMSLPFLWLILLAAFVILATFLGERTRHGYRYPVWGFLAVFFALTAGTGIALESSPLDEPVENFFIGALSKHDRWGKFIPSAERQWAQPENGLLGGEVLTVDSKNETLELEDKEKNDWSVDYKDAVVENGVKLAPNVRVNLIGQEGENNKFQADVIREPKTHRSLDDSEKKKKELESRGKEASSIKYENEKDNEDEPESEREDETEDHNEEY